MVVLQELLNARDSLERQLHELTVQLGHVEEQRLLALKDMEKLRVSDLHARNVLIPFNFMHETGTCNMKIDEGYRVVVHV